MQLLISVTTALEAQAALQGGADIIDVKNPAEGALGAANVAALRQVCGLTANLPVMSSAALGEATSASGALALAAYGAAACGAHYLKVGLRLADCEEAIALLHQIQAGAHLASPTCTLIAVGYADAVEIGALDWRFLPEVARAARIGGCMIDTALKNGRGLLDYCSEPALMEWVDACRQASLLCALAGSLKMNDLPALHRLNPNIAGFRSAACHGDRVSGRIEPELVAELRAGVR